MTRLNGSLDFREPRDPAAARHAALPAATFRLLLAVVPAVLATSAGVGCRSDLNQQLLERELRLQEDQIYQLQDELHFKGSRLDRLAVENASLKKQLGIVDADASLPTRTSPPPGVAAPARTQPSAAPSTGMPQPPSLQPPAIEFVPPPQTGPAAAPPAGGGAPTGVPQPPSLDGVPPLPTEPSSTPPFQGTSLDRRDGPTFPDPSARPIGPLPEAAMAPPVKRLSHEESIADERAITHMVINTARTGAFDGDGDGRLEGLAVVFEPRDADERLVGAVGDVVVAAFDASLPPDAPPIANWEIPSQEALGHFRRTSRARGLHFVLRWPGEPPAGKRLRVRVRMTTFEGRSFEHEETLAE
jgi:hypothetical protein